MPTPHTSRRRRTARLAALTAVTALFLAGCSTDVTTGFLPSSPNVTDKTGALISFWNGSWIALLVVGVIAWGLMIWSIIVYRKRKDDDELPVQLQYHVPLELMYTVIPIVLVGVLFVFSQRTISDTLDMSEEPDLTVQVYGKQWSWDFNYIEPGVYYSGERFILTGTEGDAEHLPTLYLPVNQTVNFELHSRDVIHAFWVPAFVYKSDMIPGTTNEFQVTPQEEGTYMGKCAEMCGEFHSEMLFKVEVVSETEFNEQMEALRAAGNEGVLGPELNRWGNQGGSN